MSKKMRLASPRLQAMSLERRPTLLAFYRVMPRRRMRPAHKENYYRLHDGQSIGPIRGMAQDRHCSCLADPRCAAASRRYHFSDFSTTKATARQGTPVGAFWHGRQWAPSTPKQIAVANEFFTPRTGSNVAEPRKFLAAMETRKATAKVATGLQRSYWSISPHPKQAEVIVRAVRE